MIRILLALVVVAPAASAALTVRLAAGQTQAQVVDALKTELGMGRRFFPDPNTMRVWNLNETIVFEIPTDASVLERDALEDAVYGVLRGRVSDRAPVRVDFDGLPTRVDGAPTLAERKAHVQTMAARARSHLRGRARYCEALLREIARD